MAFLLSRSFLHVSNHHNNNNNNDKSMPSLEFEDHNKNLSDQQLLLAEMSVDELHRRINLARANLAALDGYFDSVRGPTALDRRTAALQNARTSLSDLERQLSDRMNEMNLTSGEGGTSDDKNKGKLGTVGDDDDEGDRAAAAAMFHDADQRCEMINHHPELFSRAVVLSSAAAATTVRKIGNSSSYFFAPHPSLLYNTSANYPDVTDGKRYHKSSLLRSLQFYGDSYFYSNRNNINNESRKRNPSSKKSTSLVGSIIELIRSFSMTNNNNNESTNENASQNETVTSCFFVSPPSSHSSTSVRICELYPESAYPEEQELLKSRQIERVLLASSSTNNNNHNNNASSESNINTHNYYSTDPTSTLSFLKWYVLSFNDVTIFAEVLLHPDTPIALVVAILDQAPPHLITALPVDLLCALVMRLTLAGIRHGVSLVLAVLPAETAFAVLANPLLEVDECWREILFHYGGSSSIRVLASQMKKILPLFPSAENAKKTSRGPSSRRPSFGVGNQSINTGGGDDHDDESEPSSSQYHLQQLQRSLQDDLEEPPQTSASTPLLWLAASLGWTEIVEILVGSEHVSKNYLSEYEHLFMTKQQHQQQLSQRTRWVRLPLNTFSVLSAMHHQVSIMLMMSSGTSTGGTRQEFLLKRQLQIQKSINFKNNKKESSSSSSSSTSSDDETDDDDDDDKQNEEATLASFKSTANFSSKNSKHEVLPSSPKDNNEASLNHGGNGGNFMNPRNNNNNNNNTSSPPSNANPLVLNFAHHSTTLDFIETVCDSASDVTHSIIANPTAALQSSLFGVSILPAHTTTRVFRTGDRLSVAPFARSLHHVRSLFLGQRAADQADAPISSSQNASSSQSPQQQQSQSQSQQKESTVKIMSPIKTMKNASNSTGEKENSSSGSSNNNNNGSTSTMLCASLAPLPSTLACRAAVWPPFVAEPVYRAYHEQLHGTTTTGSGVSVGSLRFFGGPYGLGSIAAMNNNNNNINRSSSAPNSRPGSGNKPILNNNGRSRRFSLSNNNNTKDDETSLTPEQIEELEQRKLQLREKQNRERVTTLQNLVKYSAGANDSTEFTTNNSNYENQISSLLADEEKRELLMLMNNANVQQNSSSSSSAAIAKYTSTIPTLAQCDGVTVRADTPIFFPHHQQSFNSSNSSTNFFRNAKKYFSVEVPLFLLLQQPFLIETTKEGVTECERLAESIEHIVDGCCRFGFSRGDFTACNSKPSVLGHDKDGKSFGFLFVLDLPGTIASSRKQQNTSPPTEQCAASEVSAASPAPSQNRRTVVISNNNNNKNAGADKKKKRKSRVFVDSNPKTLNDFLLLHQVEYVSFFVCYQSNGKLIALPETQATTAQQTVPKLIQVPFREGKSILSVGCGIDLDMGMISLAVNLSLTGVIVEKSLMNNTSTQTTPSSAVIGYYPSATLSIAHEPQDQWQQLSLAEQLDLLHKLSVRFSFAPHSPCDFYDQNNYTNFTISDKIDYVSKMITSYATSAAEQQFSLHAVTMGKRLLEKLPISSTAGATAATSNTNTFASEKHLHATAGAATQNHNRNQVNNVNLLDDMARIRRNEILKFLGEASAAEHNNNTVPTSPTSMVSSAITAKRDSAYSSSQPHLLMFAHPAECIAFANVALDIKQAFNSVSAVRSHLLPRVIDIEIIHQSLQSGEEPVLGKSTTTTDLVMTLLQQGGQSRNRRRSSVPGEGNQNQASGRNNSNNNISNNNVFLLASSPNLIVDGDASLTALRSRHTAAIDRERERLEEFELIRERLQKIFDFYEQLPHHFHETQQGTTASLVMAQMSSSMSRPGTTTTTTTSAPANASANNTTTRPSTTLAFSSRPSSTNNNNNTSSPEAKSAKNISGSPLPIESTSPSRTSSLPFDLATFSVDDAAEELPMCDIFEDILPYTLQHFPSGAVTATPLCICLRLGWSKLAQQLARCPAVDVDAVDSEGYSAIMLCVLTGESNLLKFLLEQRNASLRQGEDATRSAANNNNNNNNNNNSSSPTSSNGSSYSALHLAVLLDRQSCMDVLINFVERQINRFAKCNQEAQAVELRQQVLDARTQLHGSTTVMLAVKMHRTALVRRLVIDLGADATTADNFGDTPLLHALSVKAYDLVTILLDSKQYSSDILRMRQRRAPRGTAILYAALDGRVDICRRLVEEGGIATAESSLATTTTTTTMNSVTADEKRRLFQQQHGLLATFDPSGLSVLHCAVLSGRWEAVEYFACLPRNTDYKVKLNLSATEERSKLTPLHQIVQQGDVELCGTLVRLLMQDDASALNKQDGLGYTPLQTAILFNHQQCALLMIHLARKKLNTEYADKHGSTALSTAAQMGQTEVAVALIEDAKAEVNFVNHAGYSPLGLAIAYGHLDTAEAIIHASSLQHHQHQQEASVARDILLGKLNKIDFTIFRPGVPTVFELAFERKLYRLCRIMIAAGCVCNNREQEEIAMMTEDEKITVADAAVPPVSSLLPQPMLSKSATITRPPSIFAAPIVVLMDIPESTKSDQRTDAKKEDNTLMTLTIQEDAEDVFDMEKRIAREQKAQLEKERIERTSHLIKSGMISREELGTSSDDDDDDELDVDEIDNNNEENNLNDEQQQESNNTESGKALRRVSSAVSSSSSFPSKTSRRSSPLGFGRPSSASQNNSETSPLGSPTSRLAQQLRERSKRVGSAGSSSPSRKSKSKNNDNNNNNQRGRLSPVSPTKESSDHRRNSPLGNKMRVPTPPNHSLTSARTTPKLDFVPSAYQSILERNQELLKKQQQQNSNVKKSDERLRSPSPPSKQRRPSTVTIISPSVHDSNNKNNQRNDLADNRPNTTEIIAGTKSRLESNKIMIPTKPPLARSSLVPPSATSANEKNTSLFSAESFFGDNDDNENHEQENKTQMSSGQRNFLKRATVLYRERSVLAVLSHVIALKNMFHSQMEVEKQTQKTNNHKRSTSASSNASASSALDPQQQQPRKSSPKDSGKRDKKNDSNAKKLVVDDFAPGAQYRHTAARDVASAILSLVLRLPECRTPLHALVLLRSAYRDLELGMTKKKNEIAQKSSLSSLIPSRPGTASKTEIISPSSSSSTAQKQQPPHHAISLLRPIFARVRSVCATSDESFWGLLSFVSKLLFDKFTAEIHLEKTHLDDRKEEFKNPLLQKMLAESNNAIAPDAATSTKALHRHDLLQQLLFVQTLHSAAANAESSIVRFALDGGGSDFQLPAPVALLFDFLRRVNPDIAPDEAYNSFFGELKSYMAVSNNIKPSPSSASALSSVLSCVSRRHAVTPLHVAVLRRDFRSVAQLLKLGANPFETPLSLMDCRTENLFLSRRSLFVGIAASSTESGDIDNTNNVVANNMMLNASTSSSSSFGQQQQQQQAPLMFSNSMVKLMSMEEFALDEICQSFLEQVQFSDEDVFLREANKFAHTRTERLLKLRTKLRDAIIEARNNLGESNDNNNNSSNNTDDFNLNNDSTKSRKSSDANNSILEKFMEEFFVFDSPLVCALKLGDESIVRLILGASVNHETNNGNNNANKSLAAWSDVNCLAGQLALLHAEDEDHESERPASSSQSLSFSSSNPLAATIQPSQSTRNRASSIVLPSKLREKYGKLIKDDDEDELFASHKFEDEVEDSDQEIDIKHSIHNQPLASRSNSIIIANNKNSTVSNLTRKPSVRLLASNELIRRASIASSDAVPPIHHTNDAADENNIDEHPISHETSLRMRRATLRDLQSTTLLQFASSSSTALSKELSAAITNPPAAPPPPFMNNHLNSAPTGIPSNVNFKKHKRASILLASMNQSENNNNTNNHKIYNTSLFFASGVFPRQPNENSDNYDSRNNSKNNNSSSTPPPPFVDTTTILHLLISNPKYSDEFIIEMVEQHKLRFEAGFLPDSSASSVLASASGENDRQVVFEKQHKFKTLTSALALAIRCKRIALVEWACSTSSIVTTTTTTTSSHQPRVKLTISSFASSKNAKNNFGASSPSSSSSLCIETLCVLAIQHCPLLLPCLFSFFGSTVADEEMTALITPNVSSAFSTSSANNNNLSMEDLRQYSEAMKEYSKRRAKTVEAIVRQILSLPRRSNNNSNNNNRSNNNNNQITPELETIAATLYRLVPFPLISSQTTTTTTSEENNNNNNNHVNSSSSILAIAIRKQCLTFLEKVLYAYQELNDGEELFAHFPKALMEIFTTYKNIGGNHNKVSSTTPSIQTIQQQVTFHAHHLDLLLLILRTIPNWKQRRIFAESVATHCHPSIVPTLLFTAVPNIGALSLPPSTQQQGQQEKTAADVSDNFVPCDSFGIDLNTIDKFTGEKKNQKSIGSGGGVSSSSNKRRGENNNNNNPKVPPTRSTGGSASTTPKAGNSPTTRSPESKCLSPSSAEFPNLNSSPPSETTTTTTRLRFSHVDESFLKAANIEGQALTALWNSLLWAIMFGSSDSATTAAMSSMLTRMLQTSAPDAAASSSNSSQTLPSSFVTLRMHMKILMKRILTMTPQQTVACPASVGFQLLATAPYLSVTSSSSPISPDFEAQFLKSQQQSMSFMNGSRSSSRNRDGDGSATSNEMRQADRASVRSWQLQDQLTNPSTSSTTVTSTTVISTKKITSSGSFKKYSSFNNNNLDDENESLGDRKGSSSMRKSPISRTNSPIYNERRNSPVRGNSRNGKRKGTKNQHSPDETSISGSPSPMRRVLSSRESNDDRNSQTAAVPLSYFENSGKMVPAFSGSGVMFAPTESYANFDAAADENENKKPKGLMNLSSTQRPPKISSMFANPNNNNNNNNKNSAQPNSLWKNISTSLVKNLRSSSSSEFNIAANPFSSSGGDRVASFSVKRRQIHNSLTAEQKSLLPLIFALPLAVSILQQQENKFAASTSTTSQLHFIDCDTAENVWTFAHIRVLMSMRGVLSSARRFLYPVSSSSSSSQGLIANSWKTAELQRTKGESAAARRRRVRLAAQVANAFAKTLDDLNSMAANPTSASLALAQSANLVDYDADGSHIMPPQTPSSSSISAAGTESVATNTNLFFLSAPSRHTQLMQRKAADGGDVLAQVSMQASSVVSETAAQQFLHPFTPRLIGVAERSLDALLSKVMFPWIALAGNLKIPELSNSTFFHNGISKENGDDGTATTSNNKNTSAVSPQQAMADKSYKWVASVCRIAARSGSVEVLELVRRILWVAFTSKNSGSNNEGSRINRPSSSYAARASSRSEGGAPDVIGSIITSFSSPLRFLQIAIVRKCHPYLFGDKNNHQDHHYHHHIITPPPASVLLANDAAANNSASRRRASLALATTSTALVPVQENALRQSPGVIEFEESKRLLQSFHANFLSADAFLNRIQDHPDEGKKDKEKSAASIHNASAENHFATIAGVADIELDLLFRPEPTADFSPIFYQIIAAEQLVFVAARQRRFEVLQYLIINPYLAASRDHHGRVLLDYVVDGIAPLSQEDVRAATACAGVLLHARAPLSTKFVRFVVAQSVASSSNQQQHSIRLNLGTKNEYHNDSLLHLAVLHDQVDVVRLILASIASSSNTNNSSNNNINGFSNLILHKNRYDHGCWEYCKSYAMSRLILNAACQAAHTKEVDRVREETENLLRKQHEANLKNNTNTNNNQQLPVVGGNIKKKIQVIVGQMFSSNSTNNNSSNDMLNSNNNNNNQKSTNNNIVTVTIPPSLDTFTNQDSNANRVSNQSSSNSANINIQQCLARFHCGVTSLHYVQHLWGEEGAVSSLAKLSTEILMQDQMVADMMVQRLAMSYAQSHSYLSRKNLLSGSMSFNGASASLNLQNLASSMGSMRSNSNHAASMLGGGASMSLNTNNNNNTSSASGAAILHVASKAQRQIQRNARRPSSDVAAKLLAMNDDKRAKDFTTLASSSRNSSNSNSRAPSPSGNDANRHSDFGRQSGDAAAATSMSTIPPYIDDKNRQLQAASIELWERGFVLEAVDSEGRYTDIPSHTCIEKTALNRRSTMRYALAAFAPWTAKQLSVFAKRQQLKVNKEALALAKHHLQHQLHNNNNNTQQATAGKVKIVTLVGNEGNNEANENVVPFNVPAPQIPDQSSNIDRIVQPWSPDQHLHERTVESLAPFFSVLHNAEFKPLQAQHQQKLLKDGSLLQQQQQPGGNNSSNINNEVTKSQQQINNFINDAISSDVTHATTQHLLSSVLPQMNVTNITSFSEKKTNANTTTTSSLKPTPPSASNQTATGNLPQHQQLSVPALRESIFGMVGKMMNHNASSLRFASLCDLLRLGESEEARVVQNAAGVWVQSLNNNKRRNMSAATIGESTNQEKNSSGSNWKSSTTNIIVPWYMKGFKDEFVSAEIVEKLMRDDDDDQVGEEFKTF